MSIFTQVKERVTARTVAEGYGLKVNKNGMACCPFHNDHHPSMKIDINYYCFSCGAKGDAVGYVAEMFGLSQYEAAQKVNADFYLGLEFHSSKTQKEPPEIVRKKKEQKRIIRIQERFAKWCQEEINTLKNCMQIIAMVHDTTIGKTPDEIFSWDEYAVIVNAEPMINYWLDILCLSELDDKQQLFVQDRGEVERIAENVRTAGTRILEGDRRDSGCGTQFCG